MRKLGLSFGISILFLSSMSEGIFAYPSHYDGEVLIDINQIYNAPPNYEYCDRKFGAGDDIKALSACQKGHAQARIMAERFGQGNGEVLATMMGLSQGIRNGYRATKENDSHKQVGRDQIKASGNFSNAKTRGEEYASKETGDTARTDAIKRFRKATESGTEPDPEYVIPASRFQGFDNGYSDEGLPVLGEDRCINDGATFVKDIPQFHDVDSTTFGSLKKITFWDLYLKSGAKAFSEYGWDNRNDAWDVWKKLPNMAYPDYQTLTPLYKVEYERVLVEEKKDPVTGQVIERVYENRARNVLVHPASYYQGIWEEGFKQSYGYYVSHYFSLAYQKNIQKNYVVGIKIGEESGRLAAVQAGTISEYNKLYKAASLEAFNKKYENSYSESFDKTFQFYSENPVIEHSGVVIAGEIDDEILTAGEWIMAFFEVQNIGGKDKKAKVAIEGNIQSSSKVQVVEVPRLSKQKIETDYLARIATGLEPGQRVSFGVTVDDVSAQDSRFYDSIHRPVEIRGFELTHIDLIKGFGQLTLRLANPSKVKNSAGVRILTTFVGLQKTITTEVEPLMGKTENNIVTIPFADIDPLFLLKQGTLRVTVAVFMGEDSMGGLSIAPSLGNVEAALAQYFNELVNQTATVPATVRLETRIGEVKRMIYTLCDRETRENKSNNIWKSNPHSTIVGQLSLFYKSDSQSVEAAQQYQDLGSALWPLRKNLGTFKRDEYRDLIQSFAPKQEGKKK